MRASSNAQAERAARPRAGPRRRVGPVAQHACARSCSSLRSPGTCRCRSRSSIACTTGLTTSSICSIRGTRCHRDHRCTAARRLLRCADRGRLRQQRRRPRGLAPRHRGSRRRRRLEGRSYPRRPRARRPRVRFHRRVLRRERLGELRLDAQEGPPAVVALVVDEGVEGGAVA